jgi:hypothetical protein
LGARGIRRSRERGPNLIATLLLGHVQSSVRNGNEFRDWYRMALRELSTHGAVRPRRERVHESVNFADVCVLENLASGFRRYNHGLENAFFSATFVPKRCNSPQVKGFCR